MASHLSTLSSFEVPDTAQWKSSELQESICTKYSVGDLDGVLYWLRQELLHIKKKANHLEAAGSAGGPFRILDIDVRLVELAIVNTRVQDAVEYYVEEYPIYRWEQGGIAPPPKGTTLSGLYKAQSDEEAKQQAMLNAFDLSRGKYISLPFYSQ